MIISLLSRNMRNRVPLFVALLSPLAVACFQELDPCAAGGANCPASAGPQNSTSMSSLVYAEGGACPAGMVVGGGDGVGGHGVCIPADTNAPAIQVGEGEDAGTTADPCVKTDQDSLAIRTEFCSMCHSGATQASTMAGFGVVLDDQKLLMTNSGLVTSSDGGVVPLLIAGDPDHSRLYNFVAGGTMPPPGNPKPTVSQVSILRSWIMCLGGGSAAAATLPAADNTSQDAGAE